MNDLPIEGGTFPWLVFWTVYQDMKNTSKLSVLCFLTVDVIWQVSAYNFSMAMDCALELGVKWFFSPSF